MSKLHPTTGKIYSDKEPELVQQFPRTQVFFFIKLNYYKNGHHIFRMVTNTISLPPCR